MLQCSPSLQAFVHLAAFIWLKRRCADKVRVRFEVSNGRFENTDS
jgi:hypothetical protein